MLLSSNSLTPVSLLLSATDEAWVCKSFTKHHKYILDNQFKISS